MKAKQENLESLYTGYQILISTASMLLVLSWIFTYYLRIIVFILSILLTLTFIVGFIGVYDRMKQKGWYRKKGVLATIRLLICIPILWLYLLPISVIFKSILTGLVLTNILDTIKPRGRKEVSQ